MRLHTNILGYSDVYNQLTRSKHAGQVDSFVSFEILEQRGSRTHSHAFEVQLSWDGDKIKGDGRRFKNTGKSGADSVYAASYDEWGWFIARLFEMDPTAKFGHYSGADNFHGHTKFAYVL